MYDMFVTELVSQLLRSWLKALAFLNLASERASDGRSERERERVGAGERTAGEVSTHRLDMSVTPVVHDVDNFELSPFTKPAKAPLSLFVYFTPSTTPVSPTAALGHLMVSPSL